MLRKSIGDGLRAARRNPMLTGLLWAWILLLGGMAAFPAWFWLGQGFNLRPESDRLLTGFNFSVYAELVQYDRSSVHGIIFSALAGILALALLANPLISGGLLAALRAGDEEATTMRRFWRGGGLYYWRFFRLLVYGILTAVPLMAGASAAFSPLVDWFDERPWEPGVVLGRLLLAGVLLLVGAWILLALDLARARTVLEEDRRPLRNWFWALLCVWRHPVATFGLIGAMAAIFAVIAGTYTMVCGLLPYSAWAAILATIVLQQFVMFLRSALRVGLVGGELALCGALLPPAPSAPVPALEPAGADPNQGQANLSPIQVKYRSKLDCLELGKG